MRERGARATLVHQLWRGKRGMPVRFAVVGGSGALVNLSMLTLLHRQAGIALFPASCVAVALSIATNFLLNNFWTFGAAGITLHRLLRFVAVSLVGMAINVAAVNALGLAGVHYLLAGAGGIGAAMSWNFLANARWTWADRSSAAPTTPATPAALTAPTTPVAAAAPTVFGTSVEHRLPHD